MTPEKDGRKDRLRQRERDEQREAWSERDGDGDSGTETVVGWSPYKETDEKKSERGRERQSPHRKGRMRKVCASRERSRYPREPRSTAPHAHTSTKLWIASR